MDRSIIVDDIRIRGIGKSEIEVNQQIIKPERNQNIKALEPICTKLVYFNGTYQQTNIFKIEDLFYNDMINGPAIIIDKNSTLLVEPGCQASLKQNGDVEIDVQSINKETSSYLDDHDLLDTTQ